jgi:hypothetical protein
MSIEMKETPTRRDNGHAGAALRRHYQGTNRAGVPCASPVVGDDEWGAFEGAAFNEFEEDIHVKPFEIPRLWSGFESLNHGANHPTVVLAWAADEDGNFIVFDEYCSPGLVSKHAREILRLRGHWGTKECWADPSVFASQGLADKVGAPASVASEYAEHGIRFEPANNDREAGYVRLLELLHVEPDRIPPPWSQVRENVGGAPRLYVFSSCTELIRQLKSAPVAADGQDAGEAVDKRWESAHGHAVASLRYGAMSPGRARLRAGGGPRSSDAGGINARQSDVCPGKARRWRSG